jgi:SAM-dependent methyltransferase
MDVTMKRRLRTRGITRRRSNAHGGAIKLNADAISAILAPIYTDLPSTKAAGEHNLTYGEIEWPTLKLILDYTNKQTWPTTTPGKFYDLGSGRGRAVLYMALAGPFDHSVGIEVLPERVSLAQKALATLKSSIPNAGAKVRFYEGSFLNPNFKYKDARAIFVSNLCLDSETQDALFKKLNLEMPKGSLLFCSKEPATPLGAFEKLGTERVPMTWTPTSEFHILRHL